jgi:hypothetical protein
MAYANVALVLSVTGEDTNMMFHGASMLALPVDTRDLFRWGMLADIMGFYLPFLVIGAYLWSAFREKAGMLGDVAMLAILSYVILGIMGAGFQQAALNPLAQLHAGGDDSMKGAAEAAWTAVAYGSQKGLWWCEGPVMLLWGLIIAKQLKNAGWSRWLVLLLLVTAWAYGGFFVLGFFSALNDLTDLLETVAVLALPLWMVWFGWIVLRRPEQVAP